MKPCYTLCADVGTTSLKAAFVDISHNAAARLAALTRVSYNAFSLGQKPTGAPDWEDAFFKAISELFLQRPDVKIEAIAISGNGPTLTALDEHLNVIKTLYWFDPIQNVEFSPEGKSFFLPHVVSFKNTNPDLYKKTSLFLSCHEWLSWRIGAKFCTVLPTKFYEDFYWNGRQCAAFGINQAESKKLTAFTALGSVIGGLSAQAANRSGLTSGTPIIGCGPDFIMALLGTATVSAGLVCDRAGSSEGINICADKAPSHNAAGIRVLPHAIEGLWNVSVVIPQSGILFDEYRRVNNIQQLTYEESIQQPGAMKVLENIADVVRNALTTLETAGYRITQMRLSGGQAKSSLWTNLKAKMIRCSLTVPEIIDAELAGNAAAAMLALKQEDDFKTACEKITVIKETFLP
ncbi:sugar kinase [Spirochaetia bacterium]|nr:sugar kinase [Spirochaetia bacterium]